MELTTQEMLLLLRIHAGHRNEKLEQGEFGCYKKLFKAELATLFFPFTTTTIGLRMVEAFKAVSGLTVLELIALLELYLTNGKLMLENNSGKDTVLWGMYHNLKHIDADTNKSHFGSTGYTIHTTGIRLINTLKLISSINNQ